VNNAPIIITAHLTNRTFVDDKSYCCPVLVVMSVMNIFCPTLALLFREKFRQVGNQMLITRITKPY